MAVLGPPYNTLPRCQNVLVGGLGYRTNRLEEAAPAWMEGSEKIIVELAS